MNETLKVLQTAKIENTDPKYDTLKKELTDIETNLDAKKVSETDQIKVLGDFLNFMQSTEDANAIATKKKEILEMKDQVETTNLKNNVEKQNYYSYFDMVQQNPTLSASIEAQLKAKGNTETLQERCDKIDSVWASFIEGAIETKLPPETLKSMSTGLSIYLTDWLNKSGLSADKIAENATDLTKMNKGIGGVVGKMFKLFGNMGGFSEIMNTVNGAAKVINTHSSSILIQDAQGKEAINPSCSAVFNTPHGFYDWMKNSIAIKQPSNTNLTFDQIFTQFQGTSTQETVRSQVIDKQNYTVGVHNLMDKVIHEGKSVLALRNSSKNTVEGVFDAIQSQLDSLQGTLSQLGINISSIGDALDSVGLKGVGDFVCMLLGYGSVQGLEKKNRSKKFDKDMTPEEKAALNQVVAYASKFMNDKSYTPTTHDDSNSFLNQYGLKSTIDGYNKDNKKPINLTLFPTSPTLIVDSFRSGLSDGKTFPDPTICQEIPELAGYVVMTTGKDGIQIPVIDGSKTKEFVDKLQDKTIVEKLVASSIAKSQDLSFLAKFSETKTNEPAKTASDYIGLLFTTCLAPTTAANAWKFDVVDRKSLGKNTSEVKLIGTGAQNAAIESKKSLENDLATAKQEKKDIETKIKEVQENKNKLSKTELEPKAKTLSDKKSKVDNDIAKIEKQLQEIESGNTIVATVDASKNKENTSNYVKKPNIENLSLDEKANEASSYLKYLGFESIQAAAIVGNIKVESNFITHAEGDKGLRDHAHGIGQWRMERFDNLLAYASSQGKDRKDFYIQLEFIKQECDGKYKEATRQNKDSYNIKTFYAAKTIEEATEIFDRGYERSSGAAIDKRIAYAKKVAENLGVA